ncbi:hypothetical protein GUITHDRAFT_143103 [Guillardia theta CCMP2712]|uniref:Thioredoxin domain-containing protein n=1 Tax=Guillardia theta (strain CCMP2712) TaxID=905079 RepID=L1IV17_GUITC|nr:hypothetical protein GUITHDRAFT_143103 [Guillardia theta CCMP2712]EKX39937.1 hypothetical protein GUITHDRAFT_143103 [Guillardia theta CCMP2712]|eukprot:XP_005826917.1 hypothetical protein GUITHDRAFT_143103 [Guillardia theta CCMP2712]
MMGAGMSRRVEQCIESCLEPSIEVSDSLVPLVRPPQVLCLLALAQGSSVVTLDDNFDSETSDPSVAWFIKFYAPWCGHCNAMKADWENLAEIYSDSDVMKIGQVDCTSETGKGICERHGVHGYPTLKYKQPGGMWSMYMSGRGKEQLASFVEDEILPKCSLENKARCSKKDQNFMERIQTMSFEERKALEVELNKEIEDAKHAHTLIAQELESKYRESKEKADRLSKKIKFELSLLKHFGKG